MTGLFFLSGFCAPERRISVEKKRNAWGWAFLLVASVLIMIFSFYPMIAAFITSLKTGSSANMIWASEKFGNPFYNYTRMFKDKMFMTTLKNTFFYLIVQVPIMLVLAILLAQLLNKTIPACSKTRCS